MTYLLESKDANICCETSEFCTTVEEAEEYLYEKLENLVCEAIDAVPSVLPESFTEKGMAETLYSGAEKILRENEKQWQLFSTKVEDNVVLEAIQIPILDKLLSILHEDRDDWVSAFRTAHYLERCLWDYESEIVFPRIEDDYDRLDSMGTFSDNFLGLYFGECGCTVPKPESLADHLSKVNPNWQVEVERRCHLELVVKNSGYTASDWCVFRDGVSGDLGEGSEDEFEHLKTIDALVEYILEIPKFRFQIICTAH